jgi:acetyl esterase/lipase
MLAEGVAAHGWTVAIPGYTLAPKASLTEIAQEIDQALDWLAAEGAGFGIAGPIVLSGWSAGGHLTALTLGHPAVSAGLAISGVYELAPIRDTALNAALRLTEAEVRLLSPLRLAVVPKPLTIAYGSAELPALVWDARHLHAARQANAAPGELVAIAGANHFSILDELRRPDGVLVKLARRLTGETV